MLLESRRQLHLGHFNTVETISLLALFAIEVWVQIVVVAIVVTMAELIARTIASTLYGMYQMVLTEKSEGTKHVRFIDGFDSAL